MLLASMLAPKVMYAQVTSEALLWYSITNWGIKEPLNRWLQNKNKLSQKENYNEKPFITMCIPTRKRKYYYTNREELKGKDSNAKVIIIWMI